MGNEIEDELEEQLEDIISKKYPKIYKGLDDGELFLDWNNYEIDEHSNRDSLSVYIVNSKTNKKILEISFDIRIHWADKYDLSFGGWEEISIIKSTVLFSKVKT
jgi:hypothetical protein